MLVQVLTTRTLCSWRCGLHRYLVGVVIDQADTVFVQVWTTQMSCGCSHRPSWHRVSAGVDKPEHCVIAGVNRCPLMGCWLRRHCVGALLTTQMPAIDSADIWLLNVKIRHIKVFGCAYIYPIKVILIFEIRGLHRIKMSCPRSRWLCEYANFKLCNRIYSRKYNFLGKPLRLFIKGQVECFQQKKCRGYDSRDTVPKKSF